jgi:PHD/YefM family antitoxin component YafN of YafNO toxin-antitoxin module
MTPLTAKAMRARPSSAIRSDYNKFSTLCHGIDEPVLVTRNGEEDLVVMSPRTFNTMMDKLRLTSELLEADHELYSGKKTIPASEAFQSIREMINAQV